MAELGNNGNRQPKVDLTAMVDLAFLLITFFMLTTSLNRPHALELAMPYKPNEEEYTEYVADRTITLLIGAENQLFWYWGLLERPIEGPHELVGTRNGLRKLLQDKKQEIVSGGIYASTGLMVIVKPSEESSYHSLVDVLDELKIVGINQYTIGDLDKGELMFLIEE